MLTPQTLEQMQGAIADAGFDGWLLFDFHGLNPVAVGLLGLQGLTTRRIFVLVPREGVPVALTHAIEQGPWRDWPAEWGRRKYSGWRALESELRELVGGKRVAMEYSPGDAVPYLDRVPAGVLEMVQAAGATVYSSADLVTRFYAVWSENHLASHKRSAEILARLARGAMERAGDSARNGVPLSEFELQGWILGQFESHSLLTDHGPIVAVGPNAADPHYEPARDRAALIRAGDILLIDLWARETDGIFADQTWMGSLGPPAERDIRVWEAVRDARDAAIALVRERVTAGDDLKGGEVDDAARSVIESRGYGEFFTHRTGHSIDPRDLHGSGPHIDNLETREERLLIAGTAFSIEPGVYLPGEVGMRSEVNAHVGERVVTVTPGEYQRDLIIV